MSNNNPYSARHHSATATHPVIRPSAPPPPAEVARHYDKLDELYRQVWGEHVHHGGWFPGDDPTKIGEATQRLLLAYRTGAMRYALIWLYKPSLRPCPNRLPSGLL